MPGYLLVSVFALWGVEGSYLWSPQSQPLTQALGLSLCFQPSQQPWKRKGIAAAAIEKAGDIRGLRERQDDLLRRVAEAFHQLRVRDYFH